MKIKKSELKLMIKEEIQNLKKIIPKKGTPEWHEHKIAIDKDIQKIK